MKKYQSLSHTRWDYKYHIVFIPKRRKKKVFGVLRRHLGLHPQPGRRGGAVRPNEARHGISRPWRLMGLWAPLRRSPSQATGFAGGI